MKSLKLLLILSVAVAAVACQGDEEVTNQNVEDCLTKASSTSGQVIEGEYIVSFDNSNPGGRAASVARVLEESNLSTDNITANFDGELSYYVMKISAANAEKLRNDARVASVEPDRIITACGCFNVIEPRSVTWNAAKVGYGDGTGKTAWIIDTGVDIDHPDLNVDKNRSKSFMTDNSSIEDDNGHGTHVAGIIGALNNNIGTLGVASGATIASLKVLDKDGDGRLSSLINAVTYVRSNGKPGDVVNISVGFKDASSTILENEIKATANRGIYFAIAAGNESEQANTYSPARTSGKNIYTVSAIDSLNNFAGFSNYGSDVVDFAAPGVRVLSSYSNGRYAYLSGTSQAAPHVAGLLLINAGKVNSIGSAAGDPDGIADPIAHQ